MGVGVEDGGREIGIRRAADRRGELGCRSRHGQLHCLALKQDLGHPVAGEVDAVVGHRALHHINGCIPVQPCVLVPKNGLCWRIEPGVKPALMDRFECPVLQLGVVGLLRHGVRQQAGDGAGRLPHEPGQL